jgi:hypothetical protein
MGSGINQLIICLLETITPIWINLKMDLSLPLAILAMHVSVNLLLPINN